MHDFNSRILDDTTHRPWPMPGAAWIMTQTWHDLLFAHWPIDAALIAAKIPAPLEIDLFAGQAWIGIVPFHMTNVTLRGVPALPWISLFPELNVRTYVRAGDKAGVYFFSLDAGNPVAVGVARTCFHLPYHSADMKVARVEGGKEAIHYTSRRRASHAELVATYRATGPVFQPSPGSIEHFLTERYCLYIVDAASRARRLEIHHPPWPLQEAAAQFERNTMTSGLGIPLPPVAPLLHFAERQDMVGWPLTRVE